MEDIAARGGDQPAIGGVLETIEGEGELDEVGLECTGDVKVMKLVEDVGLGVEGGEEEAKLGEV
jgi:hypothetical protein